MKTCSPLPNLLTSSPMLHRGKPILTLLAVVLGTYCHVFNYIFTATFLLVSLYCLLWQVIVWPPPFPIPSLSIVLIHTEQESPVFCSLSNSSLLSQVATRTVHTCLSSPWRHVAEMYLLAPLYHSEVRCDLLWRINVSSTCVSSKWWFMNQSIMWPSSVPGTTVWAHTERSIHLPGPRVSRCSRGSRKV